MAKPSRLVQVEYSRKDNADVFVKLEAPVDCLTACQDGHPCLLDPDACCCKEVRIAMDAAKGGKLHWVGCSVLPCIAWYANAELAEKHRFFSVTTSAGS